VEDKATLLLMVRFYDNVIRKGLTKVSALADAKTWLRTLSRAQVHEIVSGSDFSGMLRGLEDNTEEVIVQPSERPYSHPFYWAGFILLGDPS
jgi:CHAT domain-containing protein